MMHAYPLLTFVTLAGAAPAVTTTKTPPRITRTPIATLCEEFVDLCGQTYGGCWPSQSAEPAFDAPPCSLTETFVSVTSNVTITAPGPGSPTATEVSTPTVTGIETVTRPVSTAAPTICVDYINECGKTYGGCFVSTSPFPVFSPPACPTTYPGNITTTLAPLPTGV